MIIEDLKKTFGDDLEIKTVNRVFIKGIQTDIVWSESSVPLPEKLQSSAEKDLFEILCREIDWYLNQ